MQTTIMYLQQELRKSKQTIASLEKQLVNNHTGVNGNNTSKHEDNHKEENNTECNERTFSDKNSDSASRVNSNNKRTGSGVANTVPSKRQRSESVEFEMTYSDPEETLTALTNGK
ncbi:hypothetical protein WDU94_004236 [Cyamophila willieti]